MATVLIIEDEAELRALLKRKLTSAGHTVVEARNGKEGMAAHDETHPDVVITDIVMPEMDGLELIMALRAAKVTVPIIAMSGGGMVAAAKYLRPAKKLGAQRVFTKPIDFDEIIAAVNALAGKND